MIVYGQCLGHEFHLAGVEKLEMVSEHLRIVEIQTRYYSSSTALSASIGKTVFGYRAVFFLGHNSLAKDCKGTVVFVVLT